MMLRKIKRDLSLLGEVAIQGFSYAFFFFFNPQETGELVGTVVNVFNSGANDLLHVMCYSSVNVIEGSEEASSSASDASGRLVWIPFVEEIVPIVDVNGREMQITPPKGLLELNLRTDERSKKERRQLVRHTLC